MDVVQTSASSSSGVAWAPLLGTAVLGACLIFASGIAIKYRKSKDKLMRSIAGLAVLSVVLVATAVLLGGLEVISGGVAGAVLIAILGAIVTAFWVLVLADAATNEPSQGNEKIVWVIIIIFTYVIGAALYLAVRRPVRLADHNI